MVTVAAEPEFYTVQEVADRLRVSRKTIYRMVERGEIRAVRLGDVYRIPREGLDAFIRGEQKTETTAEVRRDAAEHQEALEDGRRRIRGEDQN
jgi:excisionase family DNA binding protein